MPYQMISWFKSSYRLNTFPVRLSMFGLQMFKVEELYGEQLEKSSLIYGEQAYSLRIDFEAAHSRSIIP